CTGLYALSLHDALPISRSGAMKLTVVRPSTRVKRIKPTLAISDHLAGGPPIGHAAVPIHPLDPAVGGSDLGLGRETIGCFPGPRSEEHTSELQSRFDLV